MSDVTRRLARFIVDSRWRDVGAPVQHEAVRAVVNWLGCALGGCRDETVSIALAALREFAGPPQAALLGRPERLDILNAALINAISSNILDFDDTHLRTVIHPTVPVASALTALAEHKAAGGAEFLHALVLGIETECRIGIALPPEHYARGWHITATCGVFGAAAACGKLLRLDEQQMTWALSIAATQAAGLTEMLGSMAKSYNIGHAARSGLVAALLAARNFTSSEQGIEAPRGFGRVLSERCDFGAIVDGLGASWALTQNAYKPYPCGIVIHPVIDACLQLRNRHRIDPAQIVRVVLSVNPLAIQLTGNPAPRTGLEGKLSLQHSAAAALLLGRVGVEQYGDACVADPRVAALRGKVTASGDAGVGKEQAQVRIDLAGGVHYELFVPHALGSLDNPLSDADLDAKFRVLAHQVLDENSAGRLLGLCRALPTLPDSGAIARESASQWYSVPSVPRRTGYFREVL